MSKTSDNIIRDAVSVAIKKEFQKIEWWNEVQDDVKIRLEWIVNRIDVTGPYFCQTFLTLFRWEFERRKLEGKMGTSPMAGYMASMLGMRIPEEAYQCGILPTRAVLNLYDFTEPNDSDVAACMFLCNKIDVLEKVGILKLKDLDIAASREEIAVAFRNIFNKEKLRQNPPSPGGKWEFDMDVNPENS